MSVAIVGAAHGVEAQVHDAGQPHLGSDMKYVSHAINDIIGIEYAAPVTLFPGAHLNEDNFRLRCNALYERVVGVWHFYYPFAMPACGNVQDAGSVSSRVRSPGQVVMLMWIVAKSVVWPIRFIRVVLLPLLENAIDITFLKDAAEAEGASLVTNGDGGRVRRDERWA